MNIKQSIMLRVRIAFILMLVGAILITWKIADIQFVHADRWMPDEESQIVKPLETHASRGNIYSSDGSVLATSRPVYELRFDTKASSDETFTNGIKALSDSLEKFFGDKTSRQYQIELEAARAESKRYVRLDGKRMINYYEMLEIQKWPIFEKGQMSGGVIFKKIEQRLKPFQNLARRTIGAFNDSTKRGVYGVEYSFQDFLAGRNGESIHERVEDGNWKPIVGLKAKRPENGLDVHTTIDINLQDVCDLELRNALQAYQADKGCVVVMEVETGKIRAISNLSIQSDSSFREDYNHAVAKAVNPGSTLKLATTIALLDNSEIDLSDTFDAGNGIRSFHGVKLRDAHHGGFGRMSFQEAFEKSSNIVFAYLADSIFNTSLIEQQKFLEYIDKFGLAGDLKFQLKGAAKPKIPKHGTPSWSGITIPWMAIGYEAELSPLQMLTFYNGVANGGKMVSPILVDKIKEADQTVMSFEASTLQKKICSQKTLKKVQKLLEGVVQNGTANNIKSSNYRIAGKTGTTQKIKNGHYVNEYYSSFVGYFPAENPRYSIIVAIDNPKTTYYGATVAAPVFRKISDRIFATDLDLQMIHALKDSTTPGHFPVVQSGLYEDIVTVLEEIEIPFIQQDEGARFVKAKRAGNFVNWANLEISQSKVPDVSGMRLRDALPILENNQMSVRVKGELTGRVTKQSILPGSNREVGKTITIWLKS